MHAHAGFGAIQTGCIDKRSYRALLLRLQGFYLPFEAATQIGTERSSWLADDLHALGADGAGCAHCPDMPTPHGTAARLGAIYLAEGSMLGGRALAGGLDHLLGPHTVAGRRFFLGRGAATGAAWQAFLRQLECVEHAHAESVASAVDMFSRFEVWMEGWLAA